MIAQQPDARGQFRIVGGHGARLAPGAQVLARIKAEAAGRAYRAGALPFTGAVDARPMGLAGVFDHRQIVAISYFTQRVHRGRQSVKMDRHDRARPVGRAELALFQVAIDALDADRGGVRIDVDENRDGAGLENGFRRGNETSLAW